MSEAAARVKVTTSMRSRSAPSPVIRRSTRSTSTVVLPEPAAALSSMLPPRASMARSCSSVHLGIPATSPGQGFCHPRARSVKYASTIAPSAMRYQPKILKSCFLM